MLKITNQHDFIDTWIMANGGYRQVSKHASDYLNLYSGKDEVRKLSELYMLEDSLMPELLAALCIEQKWIVKKDVLA